MPIKDKERERAYQAEYQRANRERIREQHREYYLKNREQLRAKGKKWYQENKAEIYRKAQTPEQKARSQRNNKKHYLKHRDKERQKRRQWYLANRDKVIASAIKRLKNSEELRIAKRLRGRIFRAVREQYSTKAGKTMELLGCSIASFRIYIESKFEPGMTWDNIHLDHIIPCSLFDLTKPEHQKICFHFSNYQPLLAKDNMAKGKRIFHEPGTLGI